MNPARMKKMPAVFKCGMAVLKKHTIKQAIQVTMM